MPFLSLPASIDIYYEVHGTHGTGWPDDPRPRVCMLMGFGATGQVWAPQLADLLAAKDETGESPMLVSIMDNRGVGRSSSPAGSRNYSTEIMAGDALALMDELGWGQFHVIGHSMGSMIGAKLAALAPQRVLSLTLISGTGGGWQAIPQTAATLWLGLKKLFVRSVRGRAAVDVQFHFSPSLLAEVDPITMEPRRETVIAEYVEAYESEGPQQAEHGTRGQLAAVMRHRLRKRDVKSIQLGQFPIQVIHGRQDVIALPKYGTRLAERLQAPCILLEGGHFVIREQAAAVNALLRSVVLGTSFANVERYPYMPFRHWVSIVEGHRERAVQLAVQRAHQGAETQQGAERRRSWQAALRNVLGVHSSHAAEQQQGEEGPQTSSLQQQQHGQQQQHEQQQCGVRTASPPPQQPQEQQRGSPQAGSVLQIAEQQGAPIQPSPAQQAQGVGGEVADQMQAESEGRGTNGAAGEGKKEGEGTRRKVSISELSELRQRRGELQAAVAAGAGARGAAGG